MKDIKNMSIQKAADYISTLQKYGYSKEYITILLTYKMEVKK